MTYKLWDTDIGRLFGAYDTEDEALALVRTLVATYGADYAGDLTLGHRRADGSIGEPLSGAALVARAEEVAARHEGVAGGSGELIAAIPRKVVAESLPVSASGRPGPTVGTRAKSKNAAGAMRSDERSSRSRSRQDD